jgi:exo-beta-1,3-glucanase (GH17 family)
MKTKSNCEQKNKIKYFFAMQKERRLRKAERVANEMQLARINSTCMSNKNMHVHETSYIHKRQTYGKEILRSHSKEIG